MKRLFVVFMSFLFILSLVAAIIVMYDHYNAYASTHSLLIPEDSYVEYDFYYDDSFLTTFSDFAPLSLPSGYSVTAFVGRSGSVDYNPMSYGTATFKRMASAANSTALIQMTFGYVITLPPTSQSGYIYVSGILPIYLYSSSSGDVPNSWSSPSSSSSPLIRYTAPTYYFLSDDFIPYGADFSNFTEYPSIGSFYVPAHDNSLNLYVISYFTRQNGSTTTYYYGAGAYMSPNASVYFIPDSSYQTSSDLSAILDAINNQTSVIENDPMSKFEDRYLSTQEDQLDQIEDMLTSSNPALPNNGDISGFISDVSDGLGLSGSSFSSSDFKSASDGFTGSSSVSEGGPWEFFSQGVADSLSGDSSAYGLEPDDYIYAWMDQSKRRYDVWDSFSP